MGSVGSKRYTSSYHIRVVQVRTHLIGSLPDDTVPITKLSKPVGLPFYPSLPFIARNMFFVRVHGDNLSQIHE